MRKLTLITGGGSGLGLALAKRYLKDSDVCIVGRNREKLDAAAALLAREQAPFALLTSDTDCAKEEQVAELFDTLHRYGYTVSKLVCCAGAGKFGKPTETTEEMARTVLDSCLTALMLPCAYALRDMEAEGSGQVLAILSTAALIGKPKESVYCAAKWGARGYCEALKAAYKGTGIKITTVSPGGIRTPFWAPDCGQTPDVSKFMDPEELAETIYHCAGVKSSSYCSDLVLDKI